MLDPERMPPPEVLSALPVFPLPNVVFMPGMVLPLNVFEPRYLDLVDHALANGRHIAVPLLCPDAAGAQAGVGAGATTDIEPVFGVGQLLSHQALPDGRRLIRLEGLGRVRARRELPTDHAFRLFEVDALDEDVPENDREFQVLKAQIEHVAQTFDDDDRRMIKSVLELDDARVVIYAICSLIPNVEVMQAAEFGRKLEACHHLNLMQACLDAETADKRVRLLIERADNLIVDLSASGSFPVAAVN